MKTAILIGALLTSFFLSLTLASQVSAQPPNLFGGMGIRSDQPTEEVPKSGLHWPKLLDFSTDKPEDKGRFRLFGQNQNSFWKPASETDNERPSLLSGFPSLLPKRDPDAPNFLQRMNSRSKDFVDRTTDWAHQKNQNIRNRTFGTWDSLTKNLRPAQPAGDLNASSESTYGAPPPVRSAENLDVQPSARF